MMLPSAHTPLSIGLLYKINSVSATAQHTFLFSLSLFLPLPFLRRIAYVSGVS